MKKISILLAACLIVFASCKKSGDGTSNTLMIGEVLRNSILSQKYTWSSDNQLIRYNEYSSSNGQSILFLYATSEYDADGNMKHRKIFTPNDTLNNRFEMFYDAAGRLTRVDYFFPGNTLNHYRIYEYDAQDRIIKYTQKDKSNKAEAYNEYAYDNEGRLTMQRRFFWNSDKWKKNYEYEYVTTGKNAYEHWEKFMQLPTDLSRSELNMASRHVITYDLSENESNNYIDSATEKQYNSSGYLVKQKITRTWTKPVKPVESWEMQYNYVQ
jgi:hypothetical protein